VQWSLTKEMLVLVLLFLIVVLGSIITSQQSSVAPAGFTNSLLVTVTTADSSIGSGQLAIVEQKIEGFNTSDLGWGTASAQPVTLSFWVRSNLTGTFGGSVHNSNDTRSYPFSYTINSANTFELKTVTIAGDTSGTWLTTNGVGIIVTFGLAVGSTFLGTAGSWSGSNLQSATGQTNLLATIGNTFYITGVMLEKGSTATNYDVRPYGTELALCQRYYYKPPNGTNGGTIGYYIASTAVTAYYPFKVSMRSTPTSSGTSATMNGTRPAIAGGITGQFDGAEGSSPDCCAINYASLSSSSSSGQPFIINSNDVEFSAEL
jgi:hypothetical protein